MLKPARSRFAARPSKPIITSKKKAAKALDPENTWQCILCKEHFADAVGFQAHHVLTSTLYERCLDADELRALDFAKRRNGVWDVKLFTQVLPSQIARLATVRQQLEALEKLGVGADLRTLDLAL